MSDEAGEGRVGTRQHVFVFDPEVYRETRASGLVWLEAEPAPARGDDRCMDGAHGGAHAGAYSEPGASLPVVGTYDDLVDLHSEIVSEVISAAVEYTPDSAPVCTPDVHQPNQRMPFLRADQ